jgi:alpha-ketoglutarate-dependent taurine dioxygenase
MLDTIDLKKKKILDERGFIFLKNKKSLSIKNFIKLCSSLGKPRIVSYLNNHKKSKYINILKRNKKEKRKYFFGDIWHSDHAFELKPPIYTVLFCKKISSEGTFTYFINRHDLFKKFNKKIQNFLKNTYFKIDSPSNFKKHTANKYNKKKKLVIKGATKNKYGYKIDVSPYHNQLTKDNKNLNLINIFRLFKIQYKVKWEKNMILIWNNNLVFHKASRINRDRLMYRMIIDKK